VRILDSKTGTGASTRVLIDFQSGSEGWTTVGASTNIIEASWRALADSMEYALVRLGRKARAGHEEHTDIGASRLRRSILRHGGTPRRHATSAGARRGAAARTAVYYASKFQGRRTASGARLNQAEMVAAHPSLPFGCVVRVTNRARAAPWT